MALIFPRCMARPRARPRTRHRAPQRWRDALFSLRSLRPASVASTARTGGGKNLPMCSPESLPVAYPDGVRAPTGEGVLASRHAPYAKGPQSTPARRYAAAGVGPLGAGNGRPRPGGSATRRSGRCSWRHWRSCRRVCHESASGFCGKVRGSRCVGVQSLQKRKVKASIRSLASQGRKAPGWATSRSACRRR